MLSTINKSSIFIEKIREAIRSFISRFSAVKVDSLDYIFLIYTVTFGYVCIHIPSDTLGGFFYVSPDAKSEHSTFYRGYDRAERLKAILRREYAGHNWLYKINSPHVPRHQAEIVQNNIKEININGEDFCKKFQIYGF